MMPEPVLAKPTALAEQDVKRVTHGDNDPEATARLRFRVEALDDRFPRIQTARDRPMYATWNDYRTALEETPDGQ